MRKSVYAIITVIIVVAIAAAATSYYYAQIAQSNQKVTVNIAVGVDAAYAPFYVAQSKGIFSQNGLNVQTRQFASGGAAADALLAGQVDLAAASDLTMLIRLINSNNITLIASLDQSTSAASLVCLSSITSPSSLIGKSIAVVKGTVSQYWLSLYLKDNNIAASQVNIMYIAPQNSVPLLDKGSISGFFLWEPWPSKSLQTSGQNVHVLATIKDIGFQINMFVAVSSALAHNHADVVIRILRSLQQAESFIGSDPAQAASITGSVLQMSNQDALAQIQMYSYGLSLTNGEIQSLQQQLEWAQSSGIITQSATWSNVAVDDQPLKQVNPSAVSYGS